MTPSERWGGRTGLGMTGVRLLAHPRVPHGHRCGARMRDGPKSGSTSSSAPACHVASAAMLASQTEVACVRLHGRAWCPRAPCRSGAAGFRDPALFTRSGRRGRKGSASGFLEPRPLPRAQHALELCSILSTSGPSAPCFITPGRLPSSAGHRPPFSICLLDETPFIVIQALAWGITSLSPAYL